MCSAPVAKAANSAAREWNEELLAAIRRNVPHPPAHARNLFHTAVAMYDAWAAYDPVPVGYIYNEKISPLPPDIEAARAEAISFAAYRVLRSRFSTGAGSATTLPNLDAKINALYGPTASATGQAATTLSTTPAELGKRIGQAILNWGANDGFSQVNYPHVYDETVNPNMEQGILPETGFFGYLYTINVLGTNNNSNFLLRANKPLGYGIPQGSNPNFWQPLSLSNSIAQNGLPVPAGVQSYVGVQGLASTPFSLTRTDKNKPWLDPFGGPSKLTVGLNVSPTDAEYKTNAMDVLRASSKLNATNLKDISPISIGNNPLGADTGTGFGTNPVPNGHVYTPNNVVFGDYVRVLAEFWADGPNSETPPGHWHVLANEVAEDPKLVKKIGGVGPVVNDLEWDVKTYFALAGAVHDAASAAWALKRYYSGARPITMIRYMCSKGQSSDMNAPSYHPEGIPLEAGVTEVITAQTAAIGGKHHLIWDVNTESYNDATGSDFFGQPYIGQIAVYSWPGEHPDNLPAPSIATHQSLVRWQLGKDWLPFQRKTFNTPAFPGYVSGHSTFSRAAAEALVLLTGSIYFPDGFHHRTYLANSMQIDLGPSADVDLQWCTYYDAADQAGQSRRWGGIHPYEDDYHGRIIGSQVGKSAFALAKKFWTGAIHQDVIIPSFTKNVNGSMTITYEATRGLYHKIQFSTDLLEWEDKTPYTIAYVNGAVTTDITGSWTENSPPAGNRFYRVARTDHP